MSPRTLFVRFAFAEAVTWALLLVGMFLKYVTATTDLGVRVFGMVHGVVFLAFVLVTLIVWINQRWSVTTGLLALGSAIPPFFTVWFERWAQRSGRLEGGWRFGREGGQEPRTLPERVLAAAMARPALAVVVGVVGVGLVTAALVVVGPPQPPGSGS